MAGAKKKDGYTALDGRQMEPEKRASLEAYDSDLDIELSSPSVSPSRGSESQEGLLRHPKPSFGKAALSYAMSRRRFSRYFTCVVASLLIIFILTLTRLKSVSETKIKLGLSKPPPPPPAWEEFPFLERYHGGIKSLVSRSANKPEYPDPENAYTKQEVEEMLEGSAQKRDTPGQLRGVMPYGSVKEHFDSEECFIDDVTRLTVPLLQTHNGIPSGFPDPVMGSHDLLNISNDACFDRYGRLGPYGFGYSRKYGGSGAGQEGEGRDEAMKSIWNGRTEIDYRQVSWANAQRLCVERNRFRFKASPKPWNHFFEAMPVGGPDKEMHETSVHDRRIDPAAPAIMTSSSTLVPKSEAATPVAASLVETEDGQVKPPHRFTTKKLLPRQAILIRTWSDYEYDEEDLFYLRALINELVIQSGAEYAVHFLVHVKDNNLPIWSDQETHQRVLNESLSAEFRGMGTLWSERQMGLIYGGVDESFFRDLPVHGVYRSTYMPVQYFAHMHPEYDFFWHWEMDIRYTGHFYHLFNRVSNWARQQPRKGLWERNSRFYVPSEHGKWEDFSQMVRVQTEHGTSSRNNLYSKLGQDPKSPKDTSIKPETSIWGPHPPTGEGDSIDLSQDPLPPTTYAQDDYKWGVGEDADLITFNPLFDPDQTNWILAEDVSGYNTSEEFPPRRTAIVTASRLSRRLLETMHREVALKRHTMFSEMWPGSCALHHGLKAVYVPHPVYIDRAWPTSYLAAIFNNGRNGAAGGARTSVFSDERQHNFLGTTWYYHAGFPGNLWKRWLGYKVDNDGGEEAEKAGEGRMCVPAMLLHPLKHVDLIYEHQEGE